MARILIIDDDRGFSAMLAEIVSDMGHEPIRAFTLREGLHEATRGEWAAILLDVNLPDGNGLTKVAQLRAVSRSAEVMIITAYGDRNGAGLALDSGAWDYIQKTHSTSEIRLSLSRALQYASSRRKRSSAGPDIDHCGIVGRSCALRASFDRLAQAARSDANLLLTGETGTGKELFARAVHQNSRRSAGPFITVDCASLTPTLVVSQLFGHERGAFTGADRRMDGLIHQADGGTLFLDEIGEMPMALQKAFLRVLQEKHYRPLGGREERSSDFRTIAATNRDLGAMVAAGRFRSDLLYRLRALNIALPPLRERPEDIGDIANVYVARICERSSLPIKSLSAEFLACLKSYPWPGNVRELVNTLESSVAAAFDDETLVPMDLPTAVRLSSIRIDEDESHGAAPLPLLRSARESVLAKAEDEYLRKLLVVIKGDVHEGCRISGLSRPQLYARLRKHRLTLREPQKTDDLPSVGIA